MDKSLKRHCSNIVETATEAQPNAFFGLGVGGAAFREKKNTLASVESIKPVKT